MIIFRKKPELENPYVFSNIEVENIDMEVQESHVNNLPRQIENICRPLSTNEPQNNINQSNNSNFVGNGVITVSVNVISYITCILYVFD